MALLIVPSDFSKNAVRALDQALIIAAANASVVEVLHITNDTVQRTYPKSWKADKKSHDKLTGILYELVLSRIAMYKLKKSLRFNVVVKESALMASGVISRFIEARASLLVMGTHGHSGMMDRLVGSNTSSIINHALFPVLAVPPRWKPVRTKRLLVTIELQDLTEVSNQIIYWSSFFKSELEVVHFSIVPNVPHYTGSAVITGIPIGSVKAVKSDLNRTLGHNIQHYTQRRKDTVLTMFVHERKLLEKIFDGSITEKVSGFINVPLLALPRENVFKYGEDKPEDFKL